MPFLRSFVALALPAALVIACAAKPPPPPPPQPTRKPVDPEVEASLEALRARAAERRADAGADAGNLYASSSASSSPTTPKTSDARSDSEKQRKACQMRAAAKGLAQPTTRHRLTGVWKCVEGEQMGNEYRLDLVQTGTSVKANLAPINDEKVRRRFDGSSFDEYMAFTFASGSAWGNASISSDDTWLDGKTFTWDDRKRECVERRFQCNTRPRFKLNPI